MLELAPRLMMAAEMVRPGSAVADIGTDHAFLPSFLVMHGISPRAVACDVRTGPLANAQKTVEQYRLEGQIELRLSDGFDELSAQDADDFVMCGMGGTLMAQLLERADFLRDGSKRLILQPQSHSEDVRRLLVTSGFEIIEERACRDCGKVYNAMCVCYTGKLTDASEAFYYVGLLPFCKGDAAHTAVCKVTCRLAKKAQGAYVTGDSALSRYYNAIIDDINVMMKGAQNDAEGSRCL